MLSQRQNTQLVLDDFLLKKNRGPYVGRGCRIINWKCARNSCRFTASTREGKLAEKSQHNHPAQSELILYKQTRAIIRQNVAVTEEKDMSSLVERVVGERGETGDYEREKVVNININALKQLARRHNRKLLTATTRTNQKAGNWADLREEGGFNIGCKD